MNTRRPFKALYLRVDSYVIQPALSTSDFLKNIQSALYETPDIQSALYGFKWAPWTCSRELKKHGFGVSASDL